MGPVLQKEGDTRCGPPRAHVQGRDANNDFNHSFFFLRATLMAYGSFQARGRIRAADASLYHSHSNIRSELHQQPTPQLTAAQDP